MRVETLPSVGWVSPVSNINREEKRMNKGKIVMDILLMGLCWYVLEWIWPTDKKSEPEKRHVREEGKTPETTSGNGKEAPSGKVKKVSAGSSELSKLAKASNRERKVERKRPVYFGDLKLKGPFADFFNSDILPHIEDFKQQKALPLLKAVMEVLEAHGDCPSVVIDSNDRESKDLYTVRDQLKRVSLKKHSYSVAIQIVRLIMEDPYAREYHLPKAIITALAHDIGKIPEFRESGLYHSGRDHAPIGAAKLKELARGMNVYWLDEAAKAIRDHHIASSDKFTQLLKKADARSREIELTYFSKEHTIQPFEEWFDAETFLRFIEADVNFIKGGRWKSISCEGVVYCFPDQLYYAGRKLCRNLKVLDLAFMPESEKGRAIKMIVDELRSQGYISDMLPEGRCAWRFKVTSRAGSKVLMLTPIIWEGFNLRMIESRKFGYLETVKVVPCPGNTQ